MSTAVQSNVPGYMQLLSRQNKNDKNGKKRGKKKKTTKSTKTTSSSTVIMRSASTGRLSNGQASLSRSSTLENLKLPSISREYPIHVSPRLTTPLRAPPTMYREILPTACDRRKKMPLLNAIKPENEKAEKERFFRANYNYNPYFIYRFPAPPEVLERISTPSDRFLNVVSKIYSLKENKLTCKLT